MKITLALFAILAIIGLGQSHQFPDFGYGPLHEDLQDFLDLVPVKKIVEVVAYYAKHDSEVQAAINFLSTTPTLKNLVIDLENIPEAINFFNEVYGQNIYIYGVLNEINRALDITELTPPWLPSPTPIEPTEPSSPTSTGSTSPTPSEPTPTEPSSPTSTGSTSPTPSKPTPTEPSSPTSTGSTSPTPSEPTPTEPSSPTSTGSTSPTPSKPTPTEPSSPTSTGSTSPTPSKPTPTEPSSPTSTGSTSPTPSKPTPTEPSSPTSTGSTSPTPSKPTPTEPSSPTSTGSTSPTPSKPTPTEPSSPTPTGSSSPTPSKPTPTEPSSPTPTGSSSPTPSKPTPTEPSSPTPTGSSSPTPTGPSSPTSTSPSTAGPTSSSVPTSASTAGPTSSPVPTPTSEYKHFFYKHNGMKSRTGGLAGLFRDVKRLFNYDAFISVYVDKLQQSTAFVDFVNEIKSENFQVLVNKIFESQSVQVIQNGLKDKVNLKIVGDIIYLLFGITIPDHVKSLEEHFVDFFYLLPAQEMVDIVVKYLNEDKEVQNAIQFVTTSEFHDLLRATEALKEHQEFVVYLQNHGLNIIQQIKELHKAIGMEDYVPPKIENFLKTQIKTQEIGGGVKALLDDLYSLLPFEKIDALFEEKISKSKIFKDFYDAITSEEFVNLYNNLAAQEPVQQLIAKSNEKGLDLAGFQRFGSRIVGFK